MAQVEGRLDGLKFVHEGAVTERQRVEVLDGYMAKLRNKR
eukprot:COSAG01_NODE_2671_length_7269_cov_10.825662_3_plen_40_part_00